MINIKFDNKQYLVDENISVLEAAKLNNIYIPSLCFFKNVNNTSDCRLCIVKINGSDKLVPACSIKVIKDMEITTEDDDIVSRRKELLKLIVSNHHFECNVCPREGKCELKNLINKLEIELPGFKGIKKTYDKDTNCVSIVRDSNKCVLCKRCIATCKNIQNIDAISVIERGFDSIISTSYNQSFKDVNCTYCGQCIINCPTGALTEKTNYIEIMTKLKDPDTLVYVQTAPSIRAALGEEFGLEIGTNVVGKMVAALKLLGFNKVFDTNVGADFTIMEEAYELINRIQNNGKLPMITSCSPAWVRFIEMNYPELLPHISTCKSPHQMLGAVIKTYYAEKMNIDPKKIYIVSIMPCISKKFEITRDGNSFNNHYDVDAVITTRELAKLIKLHDIDFNKLEDEEFDNPLGEATGAGAIFGVTGGVMEAALRTAKDLLGEKDYNIDFVEVRGEAGIKKATVNFNEKDYSVVVASSLGNARKILEDIKEGKSSYNFIEIMACPGGCVMGGGQPIVSSDLKLKYDVKALRTKVLYDIDEKSEYRKSHENPILQNIYLEYLGKPGGKKAHQLLHTVHGPRNKYNLEQFN